MQMVSLSAAVEIQACSGACLHQTSGDWGVRSSNPALSRQVVGVGCWPRGVEKAVWRVGSLAEYQLDALRLERWALHTPITGLGWTEERETSWALADRTWAPRLVFRDEAKGGELRGT